MSLRDEISDLIGDFYDGEITAREFREKFAPMYSESDTHISEIQNLFIDMDSLYAEYITHRLSESDLRKQLFELLPSTRVVVPKNNNVDLWHKVPIASPQNNSARLSSRRETTTTAVILPA